MDSDVLLRPDPVPGFLRLIAHDLRWRLMLALGRSDYRVQELVATLGQPANLVSYHLKKLREAEVVHERRSTADARDVYYSIDLGRIRDLFFAAGDALHPAITGKPVDHTEPSQATRNETGQEGAQRKARVLFLCTHNSARSQMAEGILRQIGGDMVEVYSAGTEPSRVHPDAIRTLAGIGIDISGQHSKSVEEFLGQTFDYVVTVCDKAREACPYFPGDPEQIHWSFPDPSAVQNDQERLQLFRSIALDLMTRNRFLLSLIEGDRRRSSSS